MKFKLRNFFAFGLLASFAFLFLSALTLYIAPIDEIARNNNWVLLGISKDSWKVQFVFSFILLLIFGILFLLKINYKSLSDFLKIEFPNKIYNSKELWIALILVFIIVSVSSLNIPLFRNIARVGTKDSAGEIEKTGTNEYANEAEKAYYTDYSNVSMADLTLDLIARNYQMMTVDYLIEKLAADDISIPEGTPTLSEIAKANNISINDLVRMIAYEEALNPHKRIGRPVSKRTLSEAASEINITMQQAYDYLKNSGIAHSGNDNQTLKDIADFNDITAMDVYSILTGVDKKIEKVDKRESKKNVDEFVKVAAKMDLSQLAKVISEQQPQAKVNGDILTKRLQDNDIKISDKNSTLEAIATDNNISLNELLKIISTGKRQNKSGLGKLDGPPDFLKEKKANPKAKKIGQLPLSKLAEKYNLKTNEIIKKLDDNGIDATIDQSVNEISKNNNKKPSDVIKLLKQLKKK